jgi:hypothetical protein
MDDKPEFQLNLDSKTKTTLLGLLLIMGGVGCFFLFLFSYWVNANRISSPTATTTGKVTTSRPTVWKSGGDSVEERSSCSYSYTVEGKTYTILSACGVPDDKPGEEVEIVYQTTKPSEGYVNRNSFFNFVAILGIPLLIFGWLLLRKGMRMSVGDVQSNFYYNEGQDRDFRRL